MFAERIQRTIAKQAVESHGIAILVTGKKSTFRVFKKCVAVFHHRLLIINHYGKFTTFPLVGSYMFASTSDVVVFETN